MKVLKDIIACLPADETVSRAIIGRLSVAVFSGRCGLSSHLKHYSPEAESISMAGESVSFLARGLLSDDILRASVGMAAINSALPIDGFQFESIKAQKLMIDKGEGGTVGVIGHFPFLDRIKTRFKEMYIFEKSPKPGDLTENDIPEFLPKADVVAITATSLINHSFNDIMKSTRKDSYVIMLGPSTPLCPVLFDYGIDVLCGSIIKDTDDTFRQVEAGKPFRSMNGLEYITIFGGAK